MARYLDTLRLFSRDVRLYLITAVLIGFTTFGGITTVLLNLYLVRLGYGPEFVGLVNALNLLTMAVFCLPAGSLGRRWGSRRLMIAGLSLIMAGNGLFPLAEWIPAAGRVGWLLATYMLSGAGFALYVVNINPFLMGATSPAERNHVYSMQAALWPLSAFAGSLAGGLLPAFCAELFGVSLQSPLPYRYPLLLAALLLLPGVLALWATRDSVPQPEPVGSRAEPAPWGVIRIMMGVVFLQVAGEGAARTFFNIYLDTALHVPTAQVGGLASASQLLATPAALAMPLLAARWSKGQIYLLGSLGMAMSLLPLALIPQAGAAGLGFLGVIALASLTRPAISVHQMEMVPARWQTTMSGATTMAVALSWAVMALGGGFVIRTLGYLPLFLLGAGLTAAGALLFGLTMLLPHSRATHQPALQRAQR